MIGVFGGFSQRCRIHARKWRFQNYPVAGAGGDGRPHGPVKGFDSDALSLRSHNQIND
jgi:hypothetical protein